MSNQKIYTSLLVRLMKYGNACNNFASICRIATEPFERGEREISLMMNIIADE